MRRMSPDPRRRPAALEYVGAETRAVAAKAPSSARLEKLVELDVCFIVIAPSRRSYLFSRCFPRVLPSSPQMSAPYGIFRIMGQV